MIPKGVLAVSGARSTSLVTTLDTVMAHQAGDTVRATSIDVAACAA
jgi:hypothetical protein